MASPTVTSETVSFTPDCIKNPFVKDTLDYRQKVFGSESIDVLRRWRKALSFRYLHLLQEAYRDTYQVVWEDVDFQEKTITSVRTRTASRSIPDNLAKTFIQIWQGTAKYLTITLYYRKKKISGRNLPHPVRESGHLGEDRVPPALCPCPGTRDRGHQRGQSTRLFPSAADSLHHRRG